MKRVRKVLVYITHKGRLLVFEHPFAPEAGIQVPGGSVESDEPLEAAALREAHEETGLTSLEMVGFVGYAEQDMSAYGKDEIHERSFYHLRCTDPNPPERWRHSEMFPSEGDTHPVFEFYWVQLPDEVPPLLSDHGKMLHKLME